MTTKKDKTELESLRQVIEALTLAVDSLQTQVMQLRASHAFIGWPHTVPNSNPWIPAVPTPYIGDGIYLQRPISVCGGTGTTYATNSNAQGQPTCNYQHAV